MRSLRRYFKLLSPQRCRTVPHFNAPKLEGSIIVAGELVTHLQPLGHNGTGVTKAGRLSFCGRMRDQLVKVYSCHSSEQVQLRVAIQDHGFSTLSFPEVLAHDHALVVERWIEGYELEGAEALSASRRVDHFFDELQQNKNLLQLARTYQTAFCYIDFLFSRLSRWSRIDAISALVRDAIQQYDSFKALIPICLSHPDATLSNLVLSSDTGNLYLVDNELLGSGRGWILDRQNSLLATQNFSTRSDDTFFIQDLGSKLWHLRLLGSALNSGDFERANHLLHTPACTLQDDTSIQDECSGSLAQRLYSGTNAEIYERRRSASAKWGFEERAFELLMTRIQPHITSVLDAPVGTGRFLSKYLSFLPSDSIVALDSSADMLAQARERVGGSSVIFIQHDLLASIPPLTADLVVCFRFLNLFESQVTSMLIDNLIKSARTYILLSVRLIDDTQNWIEPIEGKIYLHQRDWLAGLLKSHSFVIEAEEQFVDDRPGRYCVWLLRKET